MFLRVGGSAWKLNIGTDRLEDKINNDSEKVRTSRSKKKRRISPNKATKAYYRSRGRFPKSSDRPTVGLEGEAVGMRGGGRLSPARIPDTRHPHHFAKISDFSGDIRDFWKGSKIEVAQCYLIELKVLSETIV